MKTAKQLTTLFGSNFVAYYRAHVAHVNVRGRHFMSDHKLLGKIYEDLQEQIDFIAELLQTMKQDMPNSLKKVMMDSGIAGEVTGSADKLLKLVYDDIEQLLEEYYSLIEVAEEDSLDEIANYAQDRILALKKFCWMIDSTLSK